MSDKNLVIAYFCHNKSCSNYANFVIGNKSHCKCPTCEMYCYFFCTKCQKLSTLRNHPCDRKHRLYYDKSIDDTNLTSDSKIFYKNNCKKLFSLAEKNYTSIFINLSCTNHDISNSKKRKYKSDDYYSDDYSDDSDDYSENEQNTFLGNRLNIVFDSESDYDIESNIGSLDIVSYYKLRFINKYRKIIKN